MRALAQVFRALADETRLEMLALVLSHGELCVCDLEQVLGISQSKSSRHLRYLRNAGLLDDRRAGLWVHYRIAPGLGPERKVILAALKRMVTGERMVALEQRFEQWSREKAKHGPPCTPRPAPRPRRRAEKKP
jgi:ArsR family transcriptional regulator, arsenate/arsenite/antimonite-responsive transcriptional repressor